MSSTNSPFYNNVVAAIDGINAASENFFDSLSAFRKHLTVLGSELSQNILAHQHDSELDSAIELRDHTLWRLATKTWVLTVLGDEAYTSWLCKAFSLSKEECRHIVDTEERKEQQKHIDMLATMPYADYLKTPEWQERRAHILERDGYRCQICYSDRRLNVHHRTYIRRGNESDSDLVTLCQPCHQTFHENGRLARVRE